MAKRMSTANTKAKRPADTDSPKLLAGNLLTSVVLLSVEALALNPRNARKHSIEQIRRLRACIEKFGFLVPVLIDESRNVVLGHGRLMAARQLEMKEVPTLTVSGLTENQIRAFAIAENRLSELGEWDYDMLRIEFAELLNLNVDIEETAFSTGEVDLLLDGPGTRSKDDDEPLPLIEKEPVSREGDLWLLDQHRLLCGDALRADNYSLLLGGKKAGLVFSDPPYNVPIEGHVGGLGRVRHRDFPMGSGEMTTEQFTHFLTISFQHLTQHSRRGSIHYICMDWRHLKEILAAGQEVYSELKNLCVWNKDNAGMGSLYRSKHELILVFQNGLARLQNNVNLGVNGRYRTNVWDYPGMSSTRKGRMQELAMHPTVKPLALIADAIRDCSKRKDVVLDPFVGSGTTILAAHRTGRVAAAMELDPLYVDVAIRRWEIATGIPAVLVGSGESFKEVQASRSSGAGLTSVEQ